MTRRSSPAPGQYDLFGEIEQAEREAAERTKTRAEAEAEWQARFERVEIKGRNEVSAGRFVPVVWLGWKCPSCGEIEPNEFLLGTNHGWHPDMPGWQPRFAEGGCTKQWLQRNHAIYDARRAMLRHLAAEGLDDEQIAARIGSWSAETIAGYRKEDAKAARLAAKAARGEIVTVGHGSDCPCAFCGGSCRCSSCESFRGNG